MSNIAFDALQYGNVERNIEPGICKDSRITAMYIDTVANVPMMQPYMNFPDSIITVQQTPRILGDVRDRMEYDRLPGNGEQPPFYPPGRPQQWGTDYPGDTYRDRPQSLSFLAAAILAARRATGTAGGA